MSWYMLIVSGCGLSKALAGGAGSLFSAPDAVNSTIDMEMKIREDPLFLMK